MEYLDFVKTSPLGQSEDWSGFRSALMRSDFKSWAERQPALFSVLAAAIFNRDIQEAKEVFALMMQLIAPSEQQLRAWQQIADNYNIVSIRFVPG